MTPPIPIRAEPDRTRVLKRIRGGAWKTFALLGFALITSAAIGQTSHTAPTQTAPTTTVGHPAEPTPGKRQVRQAESAYLAGARKLQHDDLTGAEQEFQHAFRLNPDNRNYAIAISVAREHRVSQLVQQASKARISGDDKTAETLLADARSIDPQNQMVIEHSGPFLRQATHSPSLKTSTSEIPPANRALMLADTGSTEPWRIKPPILAGAIQLKPDPAAKDFDLRGSSNVILHSVAQAYGINTVIEDSVRQKQISFHLQHVTYSQAMSILMDMTGTFMVPVDETDAIVAQDTPTNRQRLDRQLEETIYLPGVSVHKINELADVLRAVFDVKKASIQLGLGSLVIRAPQEDLDPINETLQELIDADSEVMIEVKLYEISTNNATNAGATIPQQFSVFNVDQTANDIVNSNQALVQQAIAQGYITSGTSNLEIALALIQLGLVKSNLATNLLGVFGGGILRTGVSGSANATINLSLSSGDSRALDDIQLRVGDHQDAVFREGEKYPIVQSTYSTGLSTAGSALGNATINGVSVASLLSQYTGGSSATIPQVTYEDLGITLHATPIIEKSGRVNLMLNLKIEALSGASLDGNPILQSRQFSTDLTIGNGESALMVSSVTKSESAAVTGIPGVSELPGFQIPLDDASNQTTGQLVVVVTPRIVRHRSDMVAGPRIPIAGALDD